MGECDIQMGYLEPVSPPVWDAFFFSQQAQRHPSLHSVIFLKTGLVDKVP